MAASQAWLVSDTIKIGIVSLQILSTLLAIQYKDPKNVHQWRMIRMTLLCSLIFLFLIVGAHEPYYFGWQAFTIFIVLFFVINIFGIILKNITLRKQNCNFYQAVATNMGLCNINLHILNVYTINMDLQQISGSLSYKQIMLLQRRVSRVFLVGLPLPSMWQQSLSHYCTR